MITRLLLGALITVSMACATPVKHGATGAAGTCRDTVRSAAMQAYALARYRDDQRAVILLPSGPAAAAYEAETKRLRSEGARLMGFVEAEYPEAEALPPLPVVRPGSATPETVAARIAAADACIAKSDE